MTSLEVLSENFMKKIAHCLEEEEVDVYLLLLYSMSSDDMSFFEENDREKVRAIFKVLMEDTRRHAELLKLIVDMGSHT